MSDEWDRDDFASDEQYVDWVTTRPSMSEYYDRAAYSTAYGLPAVLQVVNRDNFARIELIPLPGWTWLATEHAVAKEMSKGWVPHISLTKWTLHKRAFERLMRRYHGATTTVRISRISSGGVALLAWEGLGADRGLWLLYTRGDFGYEWRANSYGPHISL
jgi:hypothetical protein